MRIADSVNDLRLRIKLDEGGAGLENEEASGGLELKDADDDSYKLAS